MSGTKEKLLAAALDLFSVKGYSATGVDEIAESIGIKGPNLYKYFKGKEDLFKQLTMMSDSNYRGDMGLDRKERPEINTPEDLKRFCLMQITYTMTNETARKLRKMYTIEQYRDPVMSGFATEHQFTNIYGLFKGMFRGLAERGLIKTDDPEAAALAFFAPTSLLIQLCDREPQRQDEAMELIKRHMDSYIGMIWNKEQE